jgi:hypothetical protein
LKIVSYRITLDSLSNGETITEFTVTGQEPAKEQIQIIKNYGANTFMTLEDIRSIWPRGKNKIINTNDIYHKVTHFVFQTTSMKFFLMWRSTIIFFLSFFSSTLRSQIVISNLSLNRYYTKHFLYWS